jgi:Uma2 family endonuclease
MTADDLATLPDDGLLYELDEGKLVSMPPSFSLAALVAANILFYMKAFVMQHAMGRCGGTDWGFRLATDPDIVRAPDASFVRIERLPGGRIPRGYYPGAPDLAVEVISSTQTYRGMRRKVRQYLAAGTRLVWLVDPEERTADVYHADGSTRHVGADGILEGEDVLPGFRLNLVDIWEEELDELV